MDGCVDVQTGSSESGGWIDVEREGDETYFTFLL